MSEPFWQIGVAVILVSVLAYFRPSFGDDILHGVDWVATRLTRPIRRIVDRLVP